MSNTFKLHFNTSNLLSKVKSDMCNVQIIVFKATYSHYFSTDKSNKVVSMADFSLQGKNLKVCYNISIWSMQVGTKTHIKCTKITEMLVLSIWTTFRKHPPCSKKAVCLLKYACTFCFDFKQSICNKEVFYLILLRNWFIVLSSVRSSYQKLTESIIDAFNIFTNEFWPKNSI